MMLVVTVKDEENAERIYAGKLLCIDNEKITLFYRGRQKTLERKSVSETINVNGIPMMLWNAA